MGKEWEEFIGKLHEKGLTPLEILTLLNSPKEESGNRLIPVLTYQKLLGTGQVSQTEKEQKGEKQW